jgi:AraC-like DNA-binding protein/quercetin dioxygenase-like cupin family protein
MRGPKAGRSTNPNDYQDVPRSLAGMAKSFVDGHEIGLHHHRRDQLLYAASGIMRIRTEREAWIVPPDRAVYIPARTAHSVSMRGAVEMRTLYIVPGSAPDLPSVPVAIQVTDLLRALIMALIEEPLHYDEAGRGGAVAGLIHSEIARADRLSLVVPMPADGRLGRMCLALLADPADARTLDQWAELAGASPRTLARLFRDEVGLSFSAWRQRVRFHNALEALVKGEPLVRVAARNGYRSPSAFSAAFRKAMGAAPSSLRDGRTAGLRRHPDA